MKKITLDCAHMTDREALHEYLAEKLELPEYYGKNLDALFDCLTDIGEPVKIVINNRGKVEEALGKYANILFTVFSDAQRSNPNITITINGISE